MTELTDKQKLAIYKKSQTSGYSTGVLEEVYRRGYQLWNESFNGNPEQFGFDRINSFIAGGFAAELDADLMEKRGLWDNIHAKRARIKAGSGERMRKPGEKGAPSAADLKNSQTNEAFETSEKQSKNPNDPSSRFDATKSLAKVYSDETPGQGKKDKPMSKTRKVIKKVVAEATYKGKKVPLNKPMAGDVKKSKVFVDPDGDGKAQKVNFGDKNMTIKKHIKGNKASYCARSGGQGNLTDRTSANYWSRKAWDC